MWRNLTMRRAVLPVLAVLVLLTVATVITAVPLPTKSSQQPPRPRAPTAAPAPSAAPILRLRPRLALRARAAASAPGVARLRIGTAGSFRPTSGTPARLRVVLTATGIRPAAGGDRIVRHVALTEAVRSAVFRHLRPGTWRWEVTAAPGWTRALVDADSGRVAVAAPAPPAPAPEPVQGTTVQAGLEAPSSSESAQGSPPAGTSTHQEAPAAQAPDSPATQDGVGGGGGGGGAAGQSQQPAAPFGVGGVPTPEGPHAP